MRLSPEERGRLGARAQPVLKGARLGLQLADLDVNVARTAWTPELSTRFVNTDSDTPPSSRVRPDAAPALLDRQVASDVALAQQLPWGTSYRVGWTGARRSNTSSLARFRPELSAGARATLIQPLLKGLTFDAARATRDVSQRNRDIAAAELDTALASTRREVLSAYWSWVYARELLDVQQQSLSLAETLLEDNRRRIAVGAMATVDAIEAEAEVARRAEAIIIGEKDVANAEDLVRMLIFEPGNPRQRDALEPDGRLDSASDRPFRRHRRAGAGRPAGSANDPLGRSRSIGSPCGRLETTRCLTPPCASTTRCARAGGTELLRENGFTGGVTGSVQRSFGSVLEDLARTPLPHVVRRTCGVAIRSARRRPKPSTARAMVAQRQRETLLAVASSRW